MSCKSRIIHTSPCKQARKSRVIEIPANMIYHCGSSSCRSYESEIILRRNICYYRAIWYAPVQRSAVLLPLERYHWSRHSAVSATGTTLSYGMPGIRYHGIHTSSTSRSSSSTHVKNIKKKHSTTLYACKLNSSINCSSSRVWSASIC